MIILDASIVNVALPSIGSRARLLAGQSLVGGQRLHADFRRLPAARRAPRRPHGPPAHVHERPRPLHGGLAAGRSRSERCLADRRARGAGPGSRARLSRRAVAHHHDLQRRRRAQQGARGLGRSGRLRWRRGFASRRHADRVGRLGVGLLRQRPDRSLRPSHWRRACCPRAATRASPRRSTRPARPS